MNDLKEKFGQIYDQYIEKIYRFIYLKVDSQETAEDITSKVFIKGWEAFKSSQGGIKNPGAFLYKTARNAVVDHYRELGKMKIVSAENIELADVSDNVQSRAIFASEIENLKIAIKGLEKEHQDIIIWYYLEDMPIEEIAELLGRPAGTVRVMLHRGLKDLRGLIQES